MKIIPCLPFLGLLFSATVIVPLLSGCVAPAPASSPASGLKRVHLTVKDHSNLNTSTAGGKVIDLPCEFLATPPNGDGTLQIRLRLKPAYGGHGDAAWFGDPHGATHEVIARTASGGDIVSISGRYLTPKYLSILPLSSLTGDVSVVATGPNAGTIISFNVTEPDVISTTREGANRYVGTYRQGGTTYSVPFQYPDHLDGVGEDYKLGKTSSSGILNSRFDGGSWFHLTASGWKLEQGEAGPESSDLSFLETKSERVDFD